MNTGHFDRVYKLQGTEYVPATIKTTKKTLSESEMASHMREVLMRELALSESEMASLMREVLMRELAIMQKAIVQQKAIMQEQTIMREVIMRVMASFTQEEVSFMQEVASFMQEEATTNSFFQEGEITVT